MPDISTAVNVSDEQQLRDMNEALLISSIRLHEQTEKAEKAIQALLAKQEQLAETQLLLETALSAGSVATVTWDIVEGRMIGDKRMAEIFGIERADNLSLDDFLSSIYPDDEREVKEQLARTLENGEPFEIEFRVVRSGGIQVGLLAWKGRTGRRGKDDPFRRRIDRHYRAKAGGRGQILSRVDHRQFQRIDSHR